jgi:hypothetical protein
MANVGYLIQVELKKHFAVGPGDSRTCFVLPPADCKLSFAEAGEKAFSLVADAVHEISRYPIMEEVLQRRVSVGDLRPFRNSLLLERDGWRCFGIVSL